jgi:hypothetical protein
MADPRDLAGFLSFVDGFFAQQSKRIGRAFPPNLRAQAERFVRLFAQHDVLRLHGGMPSMCLTRDTQYVVFFWLTVASLEKFNINVRADGQHFMSMRGEARFDTEAVLIDALRGIKKNDAVVMDETRRMHIAQLRQLAWPTPDEVALLQRLEKASVAEFAAMIKEEEGGPL